MKKLSKLLILAGVILVFGSVGGCEVNSVGVAESVHICFKGFGLVLAGTALLRLSSVKLHIRRRNRAAV